MSTHYYFSCMHRTYLQNTDTYHPNVKEYVSQMLRTNIYYTKKGLFTLDKMLLSTICVSTRVQITIEV